MPKLTMLAEAKGAPAGHTTHTYPAGRTYDLPHPLLPDDLVAAFVAMGVASVDAEVADDPDVTKVDAAFINDVVANVSTAIGTSAPEIIDAPKPKRTRKPKA